MMNNAINLLSTIEVHDLPVVKVELLFEEQSMVLWLEELVDEQYRPISITFKNVSNFYTNNPQSNSFTCESIISVSCEATENKYKATIVIEMGHSKPVFVMTVIFGEVEIQRFV